MTTQGSSPMPQARTRPPEPGGLRRERLLATIRTPGKRVVLVTAPPGAGKSTALAQHAHEESGPAGRAVAWLQIEAAETTERGFVAAVGKAVGRALGGGAEVTTTDALLALVERSAIPLTLMLDDLHVLAGTPAEVALDRLLALAPSSMRVVLAGRAEPPFMITRLRLSGALVEVGPDDLRFRSWEVEQLFRDHYGAALRPEDSAALTRHTEGWAAGLAMFHLATGGRTDEERRAAVSRLWGRSRLLRAYLAGTVLATLSPETADFMVRSSALGLLEGSLCDRLLDRRGSDRVLRDLADRQLFTLRCGEGGWYFRYHTVLQTQLEAMLREQLGSDGTRAWYGRAARVLEDAEHWPEAHRAYARAEDWGGGASMAQRYAAGAASPMTTASLDHDPWLAMAEARRLRASGNLTAAADAYRRAEEHFDDPRMRRSCRDERRAVEVWTGDPPADAPDDWAGQLRIAVSGRPEVLVRAAAGRTEDGWRLAAGLAAVLDGRPHEGLSPLHAASRSGDPFVALAARTAIAAVRAGLGEPVPADLGEIVFEAAAAGLPWLERLAGGIAAMSAESPFTELRGLCDRADADGDAWGALFLSLWCGVAGVHRGEPDPTDLTDTVLRAERLGAEVLRAWAADLLAAPARLTSLCSTTARAAVLGPVVSGPVVLRCLGGYSLRAGGQELDWRQLRPRAQAALRMLSLHAGRPVTEATLVEALWPGLAPAAARHNMHVAVSAIRTLLQPGRCRGEESVLRRRGDAYLLALPEGSELDVLVFDAAVRRARSLRSRDPAPAAAALRVALAAYRGELLPEDGQAGWVLEDRERLRVQATRAATELAALEWERGDGDTAVQAARRALDLDPGHEPAWQLLLDVHQREGNIADLVRTRRAHHQVLRELAVPEQRTAAVVAPAGLPRSPIGCDRTG